MSSSCVLIISILSRNSLIKLSTNIIIIQVSDAIYLNKIEKEYEKQKYRYNDSFKKKALACICRSVLLCKMRIVVIILLLVIYITGIVLPESSLKVYV